MIDRAAYKKAWRAQNAERLREYERARNATGRSRRYYAEHKIERRAKARAYQTTHREQARSWQIANRSRLTAQMRARRAADPERYRELDRAWRSRNPDKVRATVRRYAIRHPDVIAHRNARRRAREKNASGSHTMRQWLHLVARFDARCAYCGERKPLTRDHVIPLIEGGSDDIANIVPACLSCNSRKGRRVQSRGAIVG